MGVALIRIGIDESKRLWKMQVEAFQELYEKYQDTETSPATEAAEMIEMRLKQPFTYYYYIKVDDIIVGAIRVVDKQRSDKPKKISPIFIIKEYRNKGFAQKAIKLAEEIHGCNNWELETILQEKDNCYLYEKMGYSKSGLVKRINNNMTLVHYTKQVKE